MSIIIGIMIQIIICATWFWLGWSFCKDHQERLKYKNVIKKIKRGAEHEKEHFRSF